MRVLIIRSSLELYRLMFELGCNRRGEYYREKLMTYEE